MIQYTIIQNENRQSTIWAVLEDGTILSIPIDPANSDYQAYLEHLTENPTEDVE